MTDLDLSTFITVSKCVKLRVLRSCLCVVMMTPLKACEHEEMLFFHFLDQIQP